MSDHLEPVVSAEEAAAAAAFDQEIDGDSRNEPEQREEKFVKASEPEIDAEAAPERDYEAEALAMGWKPVDDWNGDPEKHRDAKTFVELADNDPAVLRKKYTEEVRKNEDFQKRVTAATKAEIDRAKREAESRYQQEVASLKKEKAELLREYAGDPDAIEQIDEHIETKKSQIVNPEAIVAATTVRTQWAASRPQYETDPVFTAAAKYEMERIIAEETDADVAGKPFLAIQQARFAKMDERLAATGRFNDIYGEKKTDPNPIPENGAPPANSRSIDGRSTATRKSGWDSLPADAKSMYAMLKEEGIAPSKEDYAKDFHNA